MVHQGDGSWWLTRNGLQTLVFDGAGRLVALRDPAGSSLTLTYDADGHLVSVGDASGRAITFSWAGDRLAGVSDPNVVPSRHVTYRYDEVGDLVEVVDVGGGHTTYTYDAGHRLVTLRSARHFGDTTTQPAPMTTNHYDERGRLDAQTDPAGHTTRFDYDSVPRATKVTDPAGRVTLYWYSAGLPVAVTRAAGRMTRSPWNLRGGLLMDHTVRQ